MNVWNIILKYDKRDKFSLNLSANELALTIPLYNGSVVSSNVSEFFQRKLFPEINAMDLVNLSLGVYTVDQIIPRDKYGYQGWSRHFRLFIPVVNLNQWLDVKEDLEQLLSFLSGDKWELYFRLSTFRYREAKRNKDNKISAVTLFSGGLDSFIGAIDLLEIKKPIALVSHHKKGSENKVQNELIAALEKHYGKNSFISLNFYVQPNHKNSPGKEVTSRARSFLFICLGLGVANSIDDTIKFVVPENGLISLNVPLTLTRIGSLSTRTTHPYYISLFVKVAHKLGINNLIYNPYQFFTKGEMILNCKNQILFNSSYARTLSCSHPDQGRYRGKSPGQHCGYCTPCIIRQAAEKRGNRNQTIYLDNIKKKPPSPLKQSGIDLRAFKLSIERLKRKKGKGLVFELLKGGPLPFNKKSEIDDYCEVYKRGMDEVANFLR